MATRIGRRAAIVCTDDEAAVLVAEHRDELSASFVLPEVPPGLPRMLASKLGLFELCGAHGVDTPAAAVPRTAEQLADFVGTCSFPVMAKNLEAFTRLERPAVRANTVVQSRAELMALAAGWSEPYGVLLQEYVPPEIAEDWIVHAYIRGRRAGRGLHGVQAAVMAALRRGDDVRPHGTQRAARGALCALLRGDRLPRGRRSRLALRPARRALQAARFQSTRRRAVPLVRQRRRHRRGARPAPRPERPSGAAGTCARGARPRPRASRPGGSPRLPARAATGATAAAGAPKPPPGLGGRRRPRAGGCGLRAGRTTAGRPGPAPGGLAARPLEAPARRASRWHRRTGRRRPRVAGQSHHGHPAYHGNRPRPRATRERHDRGPRQRPHALGSPSLLGEEGEGRSRAVTPCRRRTAASAPGAPPRRVDGLRTSGTTDDRGARPRRTPCR